MNQVTKPIAPWRRVSALVSMAVLLGAPAPPVRAEDLKQRKAAAVAYIA
jgi:hypothetical protein